jgi:hypothetical protein
VLISPKGDQFLYVICLHFCMTNNMVKYEAPINGMHIATELGVQRLYICGDSNIVINQVMGESNCMAVTLAWWHTNRRSESSRRSSMVSNFIISSSETMNQVMPSPDSGLAVNQPLRVCSCRTYSSHPSDSRKIAQHQWKAPTGQTKLSARARDPAGGRRPNIDFRN